MRSKFKWIFTLLLAFTMQFSFAQEKTVTGVVSDELGPAIGATVTVKGTKNVVATDFDGKFSIKAKSGDVLEVSYLGMKQNIAVGAANSYNVTLKSVELKEVVVVAQNMTKQQKALGVAVSVLTSEQIEGKPQSDVVRSMQGKLSGVQITNTGGMAGQTSNIAIRGIKSFTGSTQPLFVIDGVPFDTSQSDLTGSFNQGAAASTNRFLDLDPSNIESIVFLKSLTATVTYGEQGKNGVILVTTKKGKKGQAMNVTLTSSLYFSEIANLPDFTSKYGGGNNQIIAVGNVGNWGAAFNPNIQAPHPYDQAHLNGIFPQYIGATLPWVAAENNVKDFFRVGVASQQSILINGGSDKSTYSLNASYTDEDGIVDYNNVRKYNFGGNFNVEFTDKFKVFSSFTFFNTQFSTPPVAAANGAGAISIFERLLYLPRNFDLMNLPYQSPVDGSSVFYRTDIENPRWLLNNVKNSQNVDRFFGQITPSYDITDNLNVMYRFGFDRYTDSQEFYVNKGAVEVPYNLGYLRTTTGINTVIDQSLIFNHKPITLTGDLAVQTLLGFNARRDSYQQSGISSQGQRIFGINDHSNFTTSTNSDIQAGDLDTPLQWANRLGAYTNIDFSYSNYLYLNLSARKDWYSSLESEFRSILYPGASLSFVPSSLTDLSKYKINFLKFRAGFGTSAGFPPLYTTSNRSFLGDVFSGLSNVAGVAESNVLGNPNLKPELRKEFEFGTDIKMFDNRVKLELTYFKNINTDQIINRPVDPATGYTSTFINAGRIDNTGIEANLSLVPIRTNDFEWEITNIFYKYVSEVKALPEGQDAIAISGFSNGIRNAAVVGQPLGVIQGTYAVTDANGNLLINPGDGTIIASSDVGLENKIIGDPNPDFTLSVNNGFSYKGLSLNVLLEYTQGGDFYSNTIENLLRRGVTQDTENGRENTYVLPGFYGDPSTGLPILDANGNQIPNNVQISPNNIYFLNTLDVDSQNIYDATRLRLREISLGYALPSKLLKGTGLTGLSFSFVGSNLWLKAFNIPEHTNVDPELISTGQGRGLGLDFQTAPQSKRYGMNIKINF